MPTMSERLIPTADTLAALGLSDAELTPLESGLINASWIATPPSGAPCVLHAAA
jgi:hypothetical protein